MKRYALVVGIGHYNDPDLPNLSKPRTDAEAMAELLRDGGFEVKVLNEEITRERLRDELETLFLKRGKTDVLFYFTGHGFTAGEDEDEMRGYLATQNCQIDLKGKRILSVRQGFSFQSLNGLINRAELNSLMLLLDCCYAGSFIESMQARQKLSGLNKTNYCLVTACRSFEQAYALTNAEHSVFSTAVFAALRKQNTQVTALDIVKQVESDLRGTGQEPVYLGGGSDLLILDNRRRSVTFRVSEENPYQGLNAFTSDNAQFFFGREEEVLELSQKLNESNFVPVLGPSGIGKSSVVLAGLVPRLEAQGWKVSPPIKPGNEPITRLTAVIEKYLRKRNDPKNKKRKLLACLRENGSLAVSKQLSMNKREESSRVLLIVDQFEEVFTQCSKETQDAFIAELVKIGQTESLLSVVMTMRSDFVEEWLGGGYSSEVIRRNTMWIGALQEENLKLAIEKPAQLQGYELEKGLLSLLIKDVLAEENYLPLLEFTLKELWEKRDRPNRRLTVKAYEEVGGLAGALNRRADAIYENLRKIEQIWAKRICLQLVRFGQEEKDTRQRQSKEALLSMGGKDEQTQQTIADVIQSLVNERLLVTATDEAAAVRDEADSVDNTVSNEGYVDIAHEALLVQWGLFVQWRQEDRDLRRLEQRLKDAYREWKSKGEREDYSLTGGLLLELKEQWPKMKVVLGESWAPELEIFFLDSDKREGENIAALKQAISKIHLQDSSRKLRDQFTSNPSGNVASTLAAISLVGKSQTEIGYVTYPPEDSLHRAFSSLCERIKIEGDYSLNYSSYLSCLGLAVAFSPRGELIVSSGVKEGSLSLWDLEGNLACQPFGRRSGSITSVAFHPKGDYIVSGSSDGVICLWDLAGNLVSSPFSGHSGSITSVTFNLEGDQIISGSQDQTIRLWDLSGSLIVKPLVGHTDEVCSIALSPKGDYIVSGSKDRTLQLWTLEGESVGDPFLGHSSAVSSVAFNKNGELIVSSGGELVYGSDKTVRLWNLKGEQIGEPFQGHMDAIWSVAFSPDGKQIVSGSSDKTIRLWDLEGKSIGLPLEGHSDSVESVAFSPDGKQIVSGSSDKTIRLWDLRVPLIDKPIVRCDQPIMSVAFNSTGDQLISGSAGYKKQVLWLRDLQGNLISSPFEGHQDFIRSVAFSPDDRTIVSGSDDETLQFWNLEAKPIGDPILCSSRGHVMATVYSVAFSPKGDRLASGGGGGNLQVWDLDRRLINSFMAHKGGGLLRALAFSPKGDFIVSGGDDGLLQLFDSQGKHILGKLFFTKGAAPFVGHAKPVTSVAFSPRGECIISGSEDRTLRLWDLEGNCISEPFVGHTGSVTSVAFSPGGDRIVSGSEDRTLRLWDLEGNLIGTPFEGHSDSVWSVAFSPKGNCIVSSSDDGTLRLWRVGTWEDELRYCCTMLMHHTALTFPEDETARKACEVCEQVWTRQQSAAFAVAQGSALARRGDEERAVEKFERARVLNPELVIDPVVRAHQLAEWGYG